MPPRFNAEGRGRLKVCPHGTADLSLRSSLVFAFERRAAFIAENRKPETLNLKPSAPPRIWQSAGHQDHRHTIGDHPFRGARNIVYENHRSSFFSGDPRHRRRCHHHGLRQFQPHAPRAQYPQRRLPESPLRSLQLNGLRRPASPPRAPLAAYWRQEKPGFETSRKVRVSREQTPTSTQGERPYGKPRRAVADAAFRRRPILSTIPAGEQAPRPRPVPPAPALSPIASCALRVRGMPSPSRRSLPEFAIASTER